MSAVGGGRRKVFDGATSIQQIHVPVADCRSLTDAELDRMADVLNTWGVSVVEHPPQSEDPAEQVVALGRILGSTYAHNRADERGIVRMAPLDSAGVYLGATNREHPLHSDGAYDASPPPLLALQCVVAASTGGESVAVSALGLYRYLAATDPEALAALEQPQALHVERADQRDRKAVFGRRGSAVIAVWRDDHTSTYADDAVTQRGVDLVRAYLKDEANVLRFLLEPNQILLLDNWSVLHGRTAFADGDTRRLHRINFLGDAPFADDRLELGFRP